MTRGKKAKSSPPIIAVLRSLFLACITAFIVSCEAGNIATINDPSTGTETDNGGVQPSTGNTGGTDTDKPSIPSLATLPRVVAAEIQSDQIVLSIINPKAVMATVDVTAEVHSSDPTLYPALGLTQDVPQQQIKLDQETIALVLPENFIADSVTIRIAIDGQIDPIIFILPIDFGGSDGAVLPIMGELAFAQHFAVRHNDSRIAPKLLPEKDTLVLLPVSVSEDIRVALL